MPSRVQRHLWRNGPQFIKAAEANRSVAAWPPAPRRDQSGAGNPLRCRSRESYPGCRPAGWPAQAWGQAAARCVVDPLVQTMGGHTESFRYCWNSVTFFQDLTDRLLLEFRGVTLIAHGSSYAHIIARRCLSDWGKSNQGTVSSYLPTRQVPGPELGGMKRARFPCCLHKHRGRMGAKPKELS